MDVELPQHSVLDVLRVLVLEVLGLDAAQLVHVVLHPRYFSHATLVVFIETSLYYSVVHVIFRDEKERRICFLPYLLSSAVQYL